MTLIFDLGGHGACGWCGSSSSIGIPSLKALPFERYGAWCVSALMGLVTLTFDRLTLKLICESHLKLGTFFPNLGTLGLCVVELGYKLCTRQTDRQTDGRTKQHLLPPFLRGGDTIIILYVLVASSNMCHCSTCIPGDSCVYTERHKVKHQYEMWLSVRSQSRKHTRPKG